MPTKRRRGSSWEFIIKRRGLLPKPVSLTFPTEAEGDAYCARIEALLDRGVVPDELRDKAANLSTIEDAWLAYDAAVDLSAADRSYWPAILARFGATRLTQIDYRWAEQIVARLKQECRLAPTTIRHHVGAMARCFDWLVRRGSLPTNPLRALPRRYATYTETDVEIAGLRRADVSRERRLHPGEVGAIIGRLDGDMLTMFCLALETGMRMAEIYTLTCDQIDRHRRTIFLERTKNGDKRQVPLSTGAMEVLHGLDAGPAFPTLYSPGDDLRITSARLSRAFIRAFEAAGATDLGFHDLRHEATCRLYERTTLSDVEVAKVLGWRSLKVALRYANLRGSALAGRLW